MKLFIIIDGFKIRIHKLPKKKDGLFKKYFITIDNSMEQKLKAISYFESLGYSGVGTRQAFQDLPKEYFVDEIVADSDGYIRSKFFINDGYEEIKINDI